MPKVCRLETMSLKLATVSLKIACYLFYRFWDNNDYVFLLCLGGAAFHVMGLAPMLTMLFV